MTESLFYRVLNFIGIADVYSKFVNKVFKFTLEKDTKRMKSYEGFPSPTMKFLHQLSKRTGIKFVDHEKRDYTFYPLLKQYSYLLGGENSFIFKMLMSFNRWVFGGMTDYSRISYQIDLLSSYQEYVTELGDASIVENLLTKKYPYHILRILHKYRVESDIKGKNLKAFIRDNKDYFKEIEVYFSFDQRADVECLQDAVEELRNLQGVKLQELIVKGNLYSTIFDTITLILSFGWKLIPDMIEGFDATINNFSLPIRIVNSLSNFLTYQWYLAILLTIILIIVLKSQIVKILLGYLAFKIPLIDEYTINLQLLRFLKTYKNLMSIQDHRGAFKDSTRLISNEYLKFIFLRYCDGSEEDIARAKARSLPQIINEIPYIPKEYKDILLESQNIGKPQEGLQRVINLMESKSKKTSKKLNKYMLWGTILVSTLLFFYLGLLMYTDMMNIIEISDMQFIERLSE